MNSSAAMVEPESAPRSLRAFTAALARGRLAHAILVHGDHPPALAAACEELAARLLNTGDAAKHPDFFALRPSGKARFIKVDDLREFLHKIQLTASAGPRKVGVVYEADRMQAPTSNALLKTLEEPPDGTTLFLLTTRPNDLLPTIRSRCFHLRLPAASAPLGDEEWRAWRTDYAAWLTRLTGTEKVPPGELVLTAYGLGARFEATLHRLTDTDWEKAKANLPDGPRRRGNHRRASRPAQRAAREPAGRDRTGHARFRARLRRPPRAGRARRPPRPRHRRFGENLRPARSEPQGRRRAGVFPPALAPALDGEELKNFFASFAALR